MKRLLVLGFIVLFVSTPFSVWGQKTVRLSIATGGTGGSYYPMGGGMANIMSKYIPYVEATAEVTSASIDNCLLIGRGKADLALMNADMAWGAYHGKGKAFKEKIPLRTIAVWSPSNMHIVTIEGKGIEKVTDLKGKRVATGAPGSNTEVMALGILETYGLDPNKDVSRDKLSVSESAGALKDRKIDAFFWVGGLPTAAVTDLAATPGMRMKLIDHADAIAKMREKYGAFYVKGVIPAKTYPGQETDIRICAVWNLLVCNENMKENIAYDIVKALFEHKPELLASHSDVKYLSLEPQATVGSPIPFHPGAIRYFTEKGIKMK